MKRAKIHKLRKRVPIDPLEPASHRDLAPETRYQRGLDARKKAPRKKVFGFMSQPERPDPLETLLHQESTRIPELLPLRHSRMAQSAFAFYRGSAILMANDLGSDRPHSGLMAQLCGDAHIANFGMFASPDRSLIFDINDFDETHRGPFEWDVMRLVTSCLLLAKDNGIKHSEALMIASHTAEAYRLAAHRFAGMPEIDIWFERTSVDDLRESIRRFSEKSSLKHIEASVTKAMHRDNLSAVKKFTEVVSGERRFLNLPPTLVRIHLNAASRALIQSLYLDYLKSLSPAAATLLGRYRVVDAGHKIVGVGSVGLLAHIYLLQGRDEDDLLVLQGKEAMPSVLEPHTPAIAYENNSARVVLGQRLMQSAGDPFLGWLLGPLGRPFYIRQLRDMKCSPDFSKLSARGIASYARHAGEALARGHAKTGDMIAIAAYMGGGDTFDRRLVDFALKYSTQVQQDYQRFIGAIDEGRIESSDGNDIELTFRTEATPPRQHPADAWAGMLPRSLLELAYARQF